MPLVEGEIMVKFVDELNNKSATEASVIVDLPDTLGLIVQARREDAVAHRSKGLRRIVSIATSLTH